MNRAETFVPPHGAFFNAGAAISFGTPLDALCAELDAAFATPASFARRVRAALRAASLDAVLLPDHAREGDARSYRRHLLAADPLGRYAVASLVWQPGQMSPVHGHHTWCGYAVLEGSLDESLFRWDPLANRAFETRSHARDAGAVSFVGAGRGAIHRLGNPPGAPASAVSLHIYGVEGAHIATRVNDLVAV
jgi:predicted metal-dependent enzyme (double-stranded beta helix superfamily)